MCISRQPFGRFAPFLLQWSLYGLQNTKNRRVWCAGWSDTAYGCSKSRVHAAAAEAGGPNLQVLSLTALKSLHIKAELETCKLGPPALGACKNYTHFGPQCPPSAISSLAYKNMCHGYFFLAHN